MFSLLFGLFILGTTPKVEATTFQDNSISVIRNIKNIVIRKKLVVRQQRVIL